MSEPPTNLTPMMRQYQAVKRELPPGTLLLFQLGDFYELFFEDAQEGAQLLELTLTQRQGIPMCGMPVHAAAGYLSRLVKAGKRVALCQQTEPPQPGQVVRREVTQILSPGTTHDAEGALASGNQIVAALAPGKNRWGAALMDVTTGEFWAAEAAGTEFAHDLLARWRAVEVIFPQTEAAAINASTLASGALLLEQEPWAFTEEVAAEALRAHFKVQSLDGFGLTPGHAGIRAAGALLHYLAHDLRRDLAHVRHVRCLAQEGVLQLDPITLRHLEIFEPQRPGALSRTLAEAVDRTVTTPGARLLRQWLLQPLTNPQAIAARSNAVGFWREHQQPRERLRQELRNVRDLERLVSRLSQGHGNARDLLALRLSLEALPRVRAQTASVDALLVRQLHAELTEQPALAALLQRALADDPPHEVREGGIIRDGYDANLDELRAAGTEGKEWIARLQQQEQARTGIKSLKIRYNQVFGYYIEISAANLAAAPADYIRKQTLANAERFITPELKEMEGKILGAQERARALEYTLFLQLRQEAVAPLEALQKTARALAALDVLAGWGALAQERGYAAPEFVSESVLEIKAGRHPVLEQILIEEKFVPNDAQLGGTDRTACRLMVLTGPNMAGKSTYLRQVALLALLAHCGAWVPAERMRLGVLDRIFTRVGAGDDLARGQSTFMVEMSETANILHHATRQSLVVLDEIGRGTSTFDGLSIAWAVAEHLHSQIGALTLLATHYHELTELADQLPGVANYNVAVREWGEEVIFLRQIVPGGADKSYGIQVARLAGLPAPVLARAKELLRELEENALAPDGKPWLGRPDAADAHAAKPKANEKSSARKASRKPATVAEVPPDLFTAPSSS